MPRVEFLWWRECPSSDRALASLRSEMEAAGLESSSLERIEVTDPAQAVRLRFPGSPTIRVDGSDIEPGGDGEAPFGLTCRVYRRGDGRVSPLPDPERIKAALLAARKGSPGE